MPENLAEVRQELRGEMRKENGLDDQCDEESADMQENGSDAEDGDMGNDVGDTLGDYMSQEDMEAEELNMLNANIREACTSISKETYDATDVEVSLFDIATRYRINALPM